MKSPTTVHAAQQPEMKGATVHAAEPRLTPEQTRG